MDERIVFLEQQLAGAITHLRVSQENHAALLAQMSGHEDRLKLVYRQKRDRDEAINKQLRLSVAHLAQAAARYAFIRQHQVQIWKLGIAAEGDALDKLIDAKLEQQPTAAPTS